MDTALEIRMAFDNDEQGQDWINKLEQSELIRQLTTTFEAKPLYAIWRIIALSEIPYSVSLEYTQKVINYIESHLSTSSGFTLTGKETDLLPCYNAMLVEAFSKLGLAQSLHVQNAVQWIKQYQPFERNTNTLWTGKGVKKYGGCLKSTPCFIGVAKSVKALVYYSKAIDHKDDTVTNLINKGMDYILMHELYKRLSNKEPINKHILDLSFPASYQLNIVELLELAYITGNIQHENCTSAVDYVMDKKKKDEYWKINHIYKADGYLSFDKRGQKGDWITYLLNKYLS